MKTLYDLLGALPKDDAEELRTAFRRAAKGPHPDLHPGDPDAALRFREIVRASEILGDVEQREVYDHLLDLAQLEQVAESQQAVAAKIHKFTSAIIALAGISVMAAGSYLLSMQMSAASLAPADKPAPVMLASPTVAPPPVTTASGAAMAKDEAASHSRQDSPSRAPRLHEPIRRLCCWPMPARYPTPRRRRRTRQTRRDLLSAAKLRPRLRGLLAGETDRKAAPRQIGSRDISRNAVSPISRDQNSRWSRCPGNDRSRRIRPGRKAGIAQ